MNSYKARACPACGARAPSDEEVEAYLDEYARTLPDSVRAPEDVYARRLTICESCAHRARHTCALCGCFVRARAAKADLRCPMPGAPLWIEARQ